MKKTERPIISFPEWTNMFVRWDKAHGKWDNPPHGRHEEIRHYNMASSWE